LSNQDGSQRVVLAQVTDGLTDGQPTPLSCPIFSPHDFLQLVRFKETAELAGVGGPTINVTPPGEPPLPQSFGFGIPLETVDFFRFRAYGTAGAIPVSFFGRVEHEDRTIVPFNYVLTTDTASTVFTTTPQTGPGILLGAAASVPINSFTNGAVFAVGEIGRVAGGAFTPHTLLFSGQLSDKQPLSSVTPPSGAPVGNPTFFQTVAPTQTNGQFSFTITPAQGKRARITCVFCKVTTSGTAGARQIGFNATVNGVFVTGTQTSRWISSSTSVYVSAFPNGQVIETAAAAGESAILNGPFSDAIYFTSACVVKFGCIQSNLVSGDAASGPFLSWEET
jgi:hypothetical protein